MNGSWECYHVVRIGLGAIWGDHGRRRSLHFTPPHFCLKKRWVYPFCPFCEVGATERGCSGSIGSDDTRGYGAGSGDVGKELPRGMIP